MSFLALFRGVSAKIVALPTLAFVLGMLIPGLLGYRLLLRQAERETHEKALVTLGLLSAIRYNSDDGGLAQAATRKGDTVHPGAKVTKQIVGRYEAGRHEDSFRYRRVALMAADSRSRPDAYEARLIRAFAANTRISETEEEIHEAGHDYHVLARPVTVSQERCLSCHGSAKSAQAGRVKQYGKTASFGWTKGQVIGADVLYLPSEFPRTQAAAIFWSVSWCVGILALVCCVILFARSHVLIMRPVARMLSASEAVRKGEWPAWSDDRFPDELASLASSFHATTLRLREKIVREEKLRALFQQFIPASVAAKTLGKNSDDILAGTRHSVTVMIINIRGFKLLMDHLPPEQTVSTLNEYFGAVNRVIVANRGLVSKYMGDSVMAVFGMPLGNENHALCAVRAALGIPAALQDLYVRLEEKYGWELGVGIGISTGEPIIGSFGSSEHLEYTILGDVVGEAAQLESATKAVPEEDSILISEATYRCVMSDVHVFDLGEKSAGAGGAIHAYMVQGFRSEVGSSLAA